MNTISLMLHDITLTNFRCFKNLSLKFDASIVLIEGENGTGKTSLLEALHYACFLRSFRATLTSQLISFDTPACAIALHGVTQDESWHLVVGASPEQRMVKLNGKSLETHKQIFDYYRVITITEHDINLIAGYPQERRAFLDAALFLLDVEYGALLKLYAKVLKQRSAVLSAPHIDQIAYGVWTEKFQQVSYAIQEKRRDLLSKLQNKVQELLNRYCPHIKAVLMCQYAEKQYDAETFAREKISKRVLFGAHLDDVHIFYGESKARTYASRGQQKMLVVFFKLAIIQLLKQPTVVLLDDFMTDFDHNKVEQLLAALIAEQCQIIATCPMEQSFFATILKRYNAQTITLLPLDKVLQPSDDLMRIQPPLQGTAVE